MHQLPAPPLGIDDGRWKKKRWRSGLRVPPLRRNEPLTLVRLPGGLNIDGCMGRHRWLRMPCRASPRRCGLLAVPSTAVVLLLAAPTSWKFSLDSHQPPHVEFWNNEN